MPFGVTQNQPPKFVGGGYKGFQSMVRRSARAEGKERLRSASVLVKTAIVEANRLQDAV